MINSRRNPFAYQRLSGYQSVFLRFLYDVMKAYGGCGKFYADFYMNFVCPLGLIRINSKGKEVSCNYYEYRASQELLYPFIANAIRSQIKFGIDCSICYCIGSGENYKWISQPPCPKLIPSTHITHYKGAVGKWLSTYNICCDTLECTTIYCISTAFPDSPLFFLISSFRSIIVWIPK
ncbi:MAG: DUF4918 family protein [Lachnospiraceae bacterium]|jgi:hypothetical protein|nr:DUF4918 family protein [Lachnospiraceae bacterium]